MVNTQSPDPTLLLPTAQPSPPTVKMVTPKTVSKSEGSADLFDQSGDLSQESGDLSGESGDMP